MIRKSTHETQPGSRTNVLDKSMFSSNMNGPIQIKGPQMDMHTLEENIVSKVRSEVDNAMTTGETRLQDAVLTAIEKLVIPGVELAMKSAKASSVPSVDVNVLEPGRRFFLVNIEGLQMTTSSRINSHKNLNNTDETRGNFIVEEGDLLVYEKNIDRQPHTHHST